MPLVSSSDTMQNQCNAKQSACARRQGCWIQRKWLVLCAGFITQFICLGLPFNMSVLYVELLHEFGTSNAETSLVQSVCTGTFFVGGIISGMMITKFGTCKSGIFGGILSACGFFVSFFATSITYVVGTIGVMAGFGFSITYVGSLASVAHHLDDKQKVWGLTFVSYGSGIGAMVFPLIQEYLSVIYGWRGTVVIISGIVLNLCVCSLIFTSPTKPTSVQRIKETTKPTHRIEMSAAQKTISTIHDSKLGSTERPFKTRTLYNIKVILTNRLFIAYCLALSLTASALSGILIFFVDFFQYKGYDRDIGVWNHFGLNLSNCVFRVIPGVMARSQKISKLATPALFTVIGGLTILAFPFAENLPQMTVLSCLFGISLGGYVTILAVTTNRLVGQEYYSTGLGITLTVVGIVSVISGPLYGYITDVTGSFRLTFFIGAGSAFLAFIILVIAMLLERKSDNDLVSTTDIGPTVQIARRQRYMVPWKGSVDFTMARSQ